MNNEDRRKFIKKMVYVAPFLVTYSVVDEVDARGKKKKKKTSPEPDIKKSEK